MNKYLRKAAAFSLALCLMLAMACPAFAAQPTDRNDPYFQNVMNYYTGEGLLGWDPDETTLKLITGFQTYQQLDYTDNTSGIIAAMMIENYYTGCYGDSITQSEVNAMKSAFGAGWNEYYGVDISAMSKYFDDCDWATEKNYFEIDGSEYVRPNELTSYKVDGYVGEAYSELVDADGDGYFDLHPYEAIEFLKKNVDAGIPTIIEWLDWGGTWNVVIGYDDMGTSDFTNKMDIRDDVVIVADPRDTTDRNCDGYMAIPAARLLYTWYDNYNILYHPNAKDFHASGYRTYDYLLNSYVTKPFVIATPPEVMVDKGDRSFTYDEFSTGVTIDLSIPLNTGNAFADTVEAGHFTVNGAVELTVSAADITDGVVTLTLTGTLANEDCVITIGIDSAALVGDDIANGLTSGPVSVLEVI